MVKVYIYIGNVTPKTNQYERCKNNPINFIISGFYINSKTLSIYDFSNSIYLAYDSLIFLSFYGLSEFVLFFDEFFNGNICFGNNLSIYFNTFSISSGLILNIYIYIIYIWRFLNIF